MGIPSQSLTQFRIYSDGEVVHEDNFKYKDLGIAEEPTYTVHYIPTAIVDYIGDHYVC